MDLHQLALWIATIVFSVITLVHVFRLVRPFPVIIGTFEVPNWVSIVFVVVGAFVSYSLFMTLK